MFGDMLGNMEEQQEALKKQLNEIILQAEAGEGAVKVSANANGQITNVFIDSSLLAANDAEQLEDLVMVAANRALEKAAARQAEETQKMIQNMLPPGMGDLGGMFGA